MSFLEKLGEGLADAATAYQVIDWEKYDTYEEMNNAVTRWVNSAAPFQIENCKMGFVKRALSVRDDHKMERIFDIHNAFCLALRARR